MGNGNGCKSHVTLSFKNSYIYIIIEYVDLGIYQLLIDYELNQGLSEYLQAFFWQFIDSLNIYKFRISQLWRFLSSVMEKNSVWT